MRYLYLLLLLANIATAQTKIVAIEDRDDYLRGGSMDGIYFKDINNSIDKYTGKWEFNNEKLEVEIEIFKIEKQDKNLHYEDEILGNIRYRRKNSENLDWKEYSNLLQCGFFISGKTDKYYIIFTEAPDVKNYNLCGRVCVVSLTNDITNKSIIWQIERSEPVFNQTAGKFPDTMKFNKM